MHKQQHQAEEDVYLQNAEYTYTPQITLPIPQHNTLHANEVHIAGEPSYLHLLQPAPNPAPNDAVWLINQLKNRYGSETDLFELHTLLTEWNLLELYDFCIRKFFFFFFFISQFAKLIYIFVHKHIYAEQQLYVGVLKWLTRDMLVNLFRETNLSLGGRIAFSHHCYEWLQSSKNKSGTRENLHQSDSIVIESVASNTPINHKSTSDALVAERPTQSSDKPLLDLFGILNSNQYGVNVIESFKTNNLMTDNLRKMLGNAVLHYFIDAKLDMSVRDSEMIAKQVVTSFPGEIMVLFIYLNNFLNFCLYFYLSLLALTFILPITFNNIFVGDVQFTSKYS